MVGLLGRDLWSTGASPEPAGGELKQPKDLVDARLGGGLVIDRRDEPDADLVVGVAHAERGVIDEVEVFLGLRAGELLEELRRIRWTAVAATWRRATERLDRREARKQVLDPPA